MADNPQTPPTDLAAAIARGDRNQVRYLRHLAITAVGGRVVEDDRFLLFAGAHDYPGTYTNGVIRKSAAITPGELFARSDAFFGPLQRQYVLWVRAHADADLDVEARRRGLWPRPPADGIPSICRLAPFPAAADPEGFRLAPSGIDEDLDAYVDLVARSYGLAGADLHLAEAVLFSRASLRGSDVTVVLAKDEADGTVRAGVAVYLTAECAGLQWVVTDPAVRGRGLGQALMRTAVAWGFDHGAISAWGVSSQQGLPVWRGLGFATPTRYKRYVATSHLAVAPTYGRASLAGRLLDP